MDVSGTAPGLGSGGGGVSLQLGAYHLIALQRCMGPRKPRLQLSLLEQRFSVGGTRIVEERMEILSAQFHTKPFFVGNYVVAFLSPFFLFRLAAFRFLFEPANGPRNFERRS